MFKGELKTKNIMQRLLTQLIMFVILAVVPVFTDNVYILHIIILSNIYAVFASSWDLISGYTGQVSLGHSLFFGGGAYLAAFLTMWYDVPHYITLIIAGIIMAALSLVVGLPCLRLSGPYLAIATLAFSQAVRSIVLAFPHVTRGDEGMPLRALAFGVTPNYYISLLLMFVLVNAMHFIANYYFRIPFIAIRENEVAAKASGINVTKYRLLSFVLSAFFSGIIGSFYAYYMMAITPEGLSIDTSLMPLTMSIVGGMGTIFGPVLGAYILTFLTELLRVFIYRIRILIYALLTVVFIVVLPGGIFRALHGLMKTLEKSVFKGPSGQH